MLFFLLYRLGFFSEVEQYYASPDRQPRASALVSDSVCAEDDSANLEPTESANCVYLDSTQRMTLGNQTAQTS